MALEPRAAFGHDARNTIGSIGSLRKLIALDPDGPEAQQDMLALQEAQNQLAKAVREARETGLISNEEAAALLGDDTEAAGTLALAIAKSSIQPQMNHPSKRIRVLVVDDHPVVAFGLTAGLEPEPDIEVIGSVLTIDAGLARAETEKPDVIVTDVVFGDRPRGLELVDRFGSAATGPAILLFSNYTPPSIVTLALEHGAGGYITKEASPAEIATAVRTVASGGIYVSRELLDAAHKAPDHPSRREMEIIAAIATGATNKEIAASLGISVRTVETHLERCFCRYEVSSRAELVALAMREHWLGSR